MCAAGIALVLSGGAAAGRETSGAAKNGPTFDLTATARHTVKGYKLSIEVLSDPGRRPEVTLDVTLTKTVGIATQMHDYGFRLPAFDCAANLASCMPLRTHNVMAPYGALSMRFVAGGAAKNVPVDFPSCTGRKTQRRGTLVGSVWFKPHNAALPGYRGSFHIPARVFTETIYDCSPPPPSGCQMTGLGASDAPPATRFFEFTQTASAPSQVSSVVHVGEKLRSRHWGYVGHTLFYSALPAGAFTATPDLSRAHVDATGLPFLTGSADYVSDGSAPGTAPSSCGTTTLTSGQATGDLTAHFDGLPPTPEVPLPGLLWRQS
jgi:hypothetical protein